MTVSVRYPPTGQHVDQGHAVLVQTRSDSFLLWDDHRLQIKSPRALDALHYNENAALQVAETWVNSVPPGPDLRAIRIAGVGQPGPAVGGRAAIVGQVFQVPGSSTSVPSQYWVMRQDGLALTTEMDAYLLIGDDDIRKAYGGETPKFVEISSSDVSAAPRSRDDDATTSGFPATVPSQLDPTRSGSQVVCSAYSDTSGASTDVTVSLTDRVPGARPQTSLPFSLDGSTASQVVLPPGTAAVVRELPQDNQPTDSFFIVTDAGGKYPVPSRAVLGVLGYAGVNITPVPTGILRLIPTGPALDPASANQEASVGSNSVNIPIGPQQGGGGG
jgi:type VII secretion protein EccB